MDGDQLASKARGAWGPPAAAGDDVVVAVSGDARRVGGVAREAGHAKRRSDGAVEHVRERSLRTVISVGGAYRWSATPARWSLLVVRRFHRPRTRGWSSEARCSMTASAGWACCFIVDCSNICADEWLTKRVHRRDSAHNASTDCALSQ